MTKTRGKSSAWQHLYKRARWRRLREAHKDANPLCVYCLDAEEISEVEVVDHIKPHKGDLDLFWDPENLQSLCKACHDGRKQREDLGQNVVRFGADGWPI